MLRTGLWSPSAGCVRARGDILHWNVSGLIIWIRTARRASDCCQSESSERRGQRWGGRCVVVRRQWVSVCEAKCPRLCAGVIFKRLFEDMFVLFDRNSIGIVPSKQTRRPEVCKHAPLSGAPLCSQSVSSCACRARRAPGSHGPTLRPISTRRAVLGGVCDET